MLDTVGMPFVSRGQSQKSRCWKGRLLPGLLALLAIPDLTCLRLCDHVVLSPCLPGLSAQISLSLLL